MYHSGQGYLSCHCADCTGLVYTYLSVGNLHVSQIPCCFPQGGEFVFTVYGFGSDIYVKNSNPDRPFLKSFGSVTMLHLSRKVFRDMERQIQALIHRFLLVLYQVLRSVLVKNLEIKLLYTEIRSKYCPLP
jgi:hypothetical protein